MPAEISTKEKRRINLDNALTFAEAGLFVFPSSEKTPMIPRFNQADVELSADVTEEAISEFKAKYGRKPVHVGATTNEDVVRKMWRAFPDAVCSIASGPSGLVVIDADAKDSGPEKVEALFVEHGGLPAGAHVSPTRSGGRHYFFADPDRKFTNRAGGMKKMGCDIRGNGGQFVAPGSIREDGGTYGTLEDRDAFLNVYSSGKLPNVPPYICELIGSGSDVPDRITPDRERKVIEELEDADHFEADSLFDPVIGEYDIEELKAHNPSFAVLYELPGSDCSDNRFRVARMLLRRWPGMSAPALAAFFRSWEGSGQFVEGKPTTGEYNNRSIAREFLKNQGFSEPSSGSAFDAVEDADEGSRVTVKVSLNNPASMIERVEGVLLTRGAEIYRRGSTLVEVVTDKPLPGFDSTIPTTHLLPVNAERLGQLTGSLIDFQRYDGRKRDYVSCSPARELMNHMMARGVRSQIRRIDSVVATPLLRPDGSILSSGGYDADTEIYLTGGMVLPAMPSDPTREEGCKALGLVAKLFSECAFADREAGLSAVLSVVMGGVARLLAPNVPMLAVKAATPGSGKSYIGRLIGLMLTGRDVPVTSVAAGSSGELEKRLNAALLGGTAMIHLDNCNGRLDSDLLCQVLTERTVTVRPLGVSEEVIVSGMPIVLANGNNLLVDDNLARRTLLVELDAGVERPELRSFRLSPLQMLSQNRAPYLAAVLTALQAYMLAVRRGETEPLTPAVGSFQGWSDHVRSPLVWYGYADPVQAMTIAQAEDPEKAARKAVFCGLHELFGEGPFTASEVLARLQAEPEDEALGVKVSDGGLRLSIEENLKASLADGHRLTTHSVEVLFRDWATKVEGNFKLARLDRNANNVTTFALRPAA